MTLVALASTIRRIKMWLRDNILYDIHLIINNLQLIIRKLCSLYIYFYLLGNKLIKLFKKSF